MAGCNEANTAARLADGYSIEVDGVVYDDWFLPSKDELNLMYQDLHLNDVGDFVSTSYWSSTEIYGDFGSVWYQRFSSGYQGGAGKTVTMRVRSVRAF